jgi:hypothetical protein
VIVAICLICSSVPAFGQHNSGTPRPARLIISERAVADGLATARPAATAVQRRDDSIKNGAIIGAIVGAIALGGFVGWLCHMLQEPTDPSCVPPSLLYTGIGAGIGAAAGAGIDALTARQPQLFPPDKQPQPPWSAPR